MNGGSVLALRLLLLVAAPAVVARAAPPGEAGPERVSGRLCDALQALPEGRRAACCGGAPGRGLAGECARELGRALRDRTLTLDPADVERCAAESARALAGCDWVTPYVPRSPASCRGILHGRLESGRRCRSSLECRDGLSCRGDGPGVVGVCAPPAAPGAPCRGSPDALQTYTRQTDDARHPECSGVCRMGRCVPFVVLGDECSSDRQCVPGSHCAARRCVEGARAAPAARKAGERCTQPFECEGACLQPTVGAPGVCGMKCSAWPDVGHAAPLDVGSESDRTSFP